MLHIQSDHNIKTVISFGKDHQLAMSENPDSLLKTEKLRGDWQVLCVYVYIHSIPETVINVQEIWYNYYTTKRPPKLLVF